MPVRVKMVLRVRLRIVVAAIRVCVGVSFTVRVHAGLHFAARIWVRVRACNWVTVMGYNLCCRWACATHITPICKVIPADSLLSHRCLASPAVGGDEEISISVSHTARHKCARCWRFAIDEQHTEICVRCSSTVAM